MIKVTLTLEGSFATIKAPFMGERFKDFRLAIEGAIFNKKQNRNLATLDKVPGIIVCLREADFAIECSGELTRALAEHTTQLWNDVQGAKERAKAFDEEMRKKVNPKTGKPFYLYPFQYSGISWLTMRHGALLADDMGLGKLTGVSEPVITPEGWRMIGDLRVGDKVFGSDGLPTAVLGVYPQGRKTLYRVTMTDGAWTRAGADHLWYVETAEDRVRKIRGRVKTTLELMSEGLRHMPSPPRVRGNTKWFVPMVLPVRFPPKNLLVDPYLLGALLSNGCFLDSTRHSGTAEQKDEIQKVLPEGVEISPFPAGEWCSVLRGKVKGFNPLTRALKKLGLRGKKSPEKFIPSEYLYASVEQRLALLQGLFDNDGFINKAGYVVQYDSSSEELANNVLELARSLGASAWLSSRNRKNPFPHSESYEEKTTYEIRLSLPEGFNPFRVRSKRERFKPRTKFPPIHGIESIQSCGEEEAVCIRVAAKDHLYVTRDYILTHNTIQTIAAFPPSAKVLVVGPAVAKGVWQRELLEWRPGLRVRVLNGRSSFSWPEAGEVVVTNYDVLPDAHSKECLEARKDKKTKLPGQHDRECLKAQGNLFVPALQELAKQCKGCLKRSAVAKECQGCAPFLKDVPSDMVLVSDEAHNLKNGNAQRTVRFRGLSTAVRGKGGRVWLLTATPLMNHPIELWSVFQSALIAQEVFGDYKTFLRLFDAKAASEFGGYTFGTPDTEEIAERMQRVMLRRMKKDVLQDLPRKDWRVVNVDIDAKTLKACDAFVKEHGGIDSLVERLGKTLSFDTMSVVGKALAIAKIPAMLAMVEDFEQQDEPLVVFSAHRAPIDELAKRPGWGVITGDTSPEERSRLEASFQAGELRGIGATIRAGGVSITLTYACNVLRVDREWTPALNEQAADRVYRLGQDRPVMVTDLVANHPLDERVTELTTDKQVLIDASVDAARLMEREVTREAEPQRPQHPGGGPLLGLAHVDMLEGVLKEQGSPHGNEP